MRYLLILSQLALLTACGQEMAPTITTPEPPIAPVPVVKALQSLWQSDTNYKLDLTNVPFGGANNQLRFIYDNGAICLAGSTLLGDENSGTLAIGGNHYIGGGPMDPGCAAFNAGYSYTKTDTVLTVCHSMTHVCETYN